MLWNALRNGNTDSATLGGTSVDTIGVLASKHITTTSGLVMAQGLSQ
jgi:hypothetical protein